MLDYVGKSAKFYLLKNIYLKFSNPISLAKKIFIIGICSLIYTITFLAFYNLLLTGEVIPHEHLKLVLESLLYNFIILFAIVVFNYLAIFKIKFKIYNDKMIIIKILVDLFFWILIFFGTYKLFLFILGQFKSGLRFDWVGSSLNAFIIFLILETIYFIRSSRISLKNAEEERRKVLQYQYDALKSQINPHFLFNSLNLLYSLVSIDQVKSKEFILSLSSMYRYIMEHQNKDKIPLSDELKFLTAYLEVLEMRYHNQLLVEYVRNERPIDAKIIPFTLQLVIENVTKHNVISKKYPMKVRIEIEEDRIIVSNPIRRKISQQSNGIGLRYISEIYHSFGKDFKIENDEIDFKAIIPYL